MDSWKVNETKRGLPSTTEDMDFQMEAVRICRSYGAGSEQYHRFLQDVNSSLLGQILELPKFVPGDIRNSSTQSSKQKKRRHKASINSKRPPLPKILSKDAHAIRGMENKNTEVNMHNHDVLSGPTPNTTREEVQSRQASNEEAKTPLNQPPASATTTTTITTIVEQLTPNDTTTTALIEATNPTSTIPGVYKERPSLQKSATEVTRKVTSGGDNGRNLRRTVSSLPNEQVTMDEQVARQLQSLLREKAELLKENSRLKNENSGLHELLQYATCEASNDEGEDSGLYHDDVMPTKEAIRRSGIQAWHPTEFCTPDSASSFGIGSASSTDEKETQLTNVNQILPPTLELLR